MSKNITTPASVAARLTDEEIMKFSRMAEYNFSNDAAAVLRDYVRMRKLANAVIDRIKRYHASLENPMCAFNDIKRMVAEAAGEEVSDG